MCQIVNCPVYFLQHVLQVLSYKIIYSNLPSVLVIYFPSCEGYILYQRKEYITEYSPLIPALPPRLYETHPETSKKANPETSKKAK